jgi:hypothetical protein
LALVVAMAAMVQTPHFLLSLLPLAVVPITVYMEPLEAQVVVLRQ